MTTKVHGDPLEFRFPSPASNSADEAKLATRQQDRIRCERRFRHNRQANPMLRWVHRFAVDRARVDEMFA
jgi:hypothetical protein